MIVIQSTMRRPAMSRAHRTLGYNPRTQRPLAGVDKDALAETMPLILLGLAAAGLAIWSSR